MTLKAIFWDNDGVLVDTEHLYFLANQRALSTIGVELTRELYVEHFLVQSTGAWHLAAEKGATPGEIEVLRNLRNAEFSRLITGDSLVMPGVRPVLNRLHGRFSMGIVTSSEREHFSLIHRTSDLLRYFSFVLASGDYPRSKPQPDPYLAALKRSGVSADECVVVEDSRRGLASAVAAGLRCIVVPSALTVESDFSGAWAVLDSLERLPEMIEDLA